MTLRDLYGRHARELLAFARRRVGPSEAADVVQDTYLRLARFAGQVPLDNARAYLFRIAATVGADAAGAGARRDRLEEAAQACASPDGAPPAHEALEARQRLERCLAALDRLPAVQRHAFLLHRVEGRSQAEVAEAFNISLRSVQRYVAWALAACLAADRVELAARTPGDRLTSEEDP